MRDKRSTGFAVLAAGVLALLLAGCGARLGAQPGTGIRGMIMAGPSCPNAQQASPCPDRPLAAEVQVLEASGRQVTTFKSDSTGHFKVDLEPGIYTLKSVSTSWGLPPTASPTTVTVTHGTYMWVLLTLDTGIR